MRKRSNSSYLVNLGKLNDKGEVYIWWTWARGKSAVMCLFLKRWAAMMSVHLLVHLIFWAPSWTVIIYPANKLPKTWATEINSQSKRKQVTPDTNHMWRGSQDIRMFHFACQGERRKWVIFILPFLSIQPKHKDLF